MATKQAFHSVRRHFTFVQLDKNQLTLGCEQSQKKENLPHSLTVSTRGIGIIQWPLQRFLSRPNRCTSLQLSGNQLMIRIRDHNT